MSLVLVAAVAACSHGPKHSPGDEYLKAIKFEGNRELGKKRLVAGLGLHRTQERGRAPDPYLVQVDADRIRGEYLREGYLAVDVRSRVERQGDAATVIYTVEEGVRARTKVVIEGLPPADPDLPITMVRKQIALADGADFDYAVYDLAKQPLMRVVQNAGYAHAKLDAIVYADRANHEAIIQLNYTLGPKCTFGTVEITGVNGDLADAVRNRVRFSTGDRYSTRAINRTQRALYAFGRFSTVQVLPSEKPDAVVNVKIAVSEGARREIKFGGGFGIDPTAYEVRGRAGYTIAGWPFPLDTLTLDARPAYARLRDTGEYEPRMRALAKLERQDIFWTHSKGEVEVGYNYLAVEAYTSYGPHTRIGFSTPLNFDKPRQLQLRVGWGLERLDFRRISPLIDPALQMQLELDHPQQVGAYSQAFVADYRDHQIEPRLGWYGEFRITEGTRYAGGAYEYLQVVPELRGFVPIGPVTLAGRIRTGGIFGDVPATERFFSGGGSNHRGFGERQLSPYVSGNDGTADRIIPYGGAGLLETGLEARIPITSWRGIPIGSVVFLDGGDVTERYGDLDPSNLHWALGTGLRAMTIVGPVRLDFGYRLNRKGPLDPAPGSPFAVHLSLGEAF
ncbi:MAG: BamA/TamA family outer membrane protein [Kofleriaceae bacterium]